MADKIRKFLASLPNKKLLLVRGYLDRIQRNDTNGMDVKPLKGQKGVYRVRIGGYRIVFRPVGNGVAEVLYVDKRDDQTYRDF